MTKTATNIEEVIENLDNIIDWAKKNRPVLGFFPLLYRKVTVAVKDKIAQNYFDDGARMEKLDVVFANRYIQAFYLLRQNEETTLSWQKAFSAPNNLLVLQHLMLGMNAHINLDLGVACAEVMDGQSLMPIRSDFNKINSILSDMLGDVQGNINKLSPFFWLIDSLAGKWDERLAKFSLKATREFAWNTAVEFHALEKSEFEDKLRIQDEQVEALSHLIINPAIYYRLKMSILKIFEAKDFHVIYETLQ